jgi:hypothetical protein
MANNKDTVKMVFKIVESVAWVIGPAIFALSFFSFKVSKSGMYYQPGSEWGMAIGVLFISLAFVARQWQK